MTEPNPDTDQLLQRAAGGDESAAHELLGRCRPRLRRMVGLHMDQRISARIDPSDVVQEALAEAFQRLPEYIQKRAISFYPWIRQITWQRLVKLHRAHITTARRSVQREGGELSMLLPEDSVLELAAQLASSGTEPGQRLVREEMRERVRTALHEMRLADRTLLVMRYLEHMTLKEISEVLQISTAATKMRHARALQRLERLLHDEP